MHTVSRVSFYFSPFYKKKKILHISFLLLNISYSTFSLHCLQNSLVRKVLRGRKNLRIFYDSDFKEWWTIQVLKNVNGALIVAADSGTIYNSVTAKSTEKNCNDQLSRWMYFEQFSQVFVNENGVAVLWFVSFANTMLVVIRYIDICLFYLQF